MGEADHGDHDDRRRRLLGRYAGHPGRHLREVTGSGPIDRSTAGTETQSRRLFIPSLTFRRDRRLRRIVELAGWELRVFGRPRPGETVGIWGNAGTAARAHRLAEKTGAQKLYLEDAFLRSVRPGRDGDPTMGIVFDATGLHFDATRPSDLETLLATHPLDDTALLTRARHAAEHMVGAHLSKYNDFDPGLPLPDAPFVLIVDQTAGDASLMGADRARFHEMLATAAEEHPGMALVVKTHPETVAGLRPGHFGAQDASPHVTLVDTPVDPWALLARAAAVYTVSSGLGFEAILAGHKPRVFGTPWYAGWGLTVDEEVFPRRGRRLTRTQAFAAAMLLYPTWYDPYHDTLCGPEQVLSALEAQARAWREDRRGYVAAGMSGWKRGPLTRFFGPGIAFRDGPAAVAEAERTGRRLMVWAGKAETLGETGDTPVLRVEDGFLRSRGLGADLVAPLSLVRDDLGIYYDPTAESRLERLIAASARLPEGARARADRLVAGLIRARLSKYNLAGGVPELPAGQRILVPGQVEDDASIRLGCGAISTNLGLLQATRAANPGAVVVYKPHPDVEAGLRAGAVPADALAGLADVVAEGADPVALIEAVDEVWTLTSLLGFEALIRGRKVTCLGAPFYAGWGLTTDLGPVPRRRWARPDVTALAHAALIAYPRYHDPVTGMPCPVELVADRLAAGVTAPRGARTGLLARAQGLTVGRFGPWWRRARR
ncbi:MAG: capsular polysaccharide biosynthesis protein [Maritimibacter sp.]|nr:capsular polysaccharide biosynthesis protein [Maritimibacter sp.]